MTAEEENCRIIKLTQGKVALVDADDYEWLSQWKWHVKWDSSIGNFYAKRNEKGTETRRQVTVMMHRAILGLEYGDRRQADHINHDTLDNRRSNLRIATSSQNTANQRRRSATISGVKGVRWHSRDKVWQVQLKVNGKGVYIGSFEDKHEAAKAYQIAAKEHYGEFANFG